MWPENGANPTALHFRVLILQNDGNKGQALLALGYAANAAASVLCALTGVALAV